MNKKLISWFEGKKIMILGLGREGLSTYNFIRKYYPAVSLTLADKKKLSDLGEDFLKISTSDQNTNFKLGKDYLSDLNKFDLIIKTPGIPNKLPEIRAARKGKVKFTSQTGIFLSLFKDKTIGITGTKGKGTTSSLIYHILNSSGKKVELLGNIGRPVLDYVEGDKNIEYFVFEMSSHQLSDISVSPHIALFLNIFPEHLDYYENYDDYVNAKANITKYQSTSDLFFYNSTFPEINNIAKKSPATVIDFKETKLTKIKTRLKGEHNLLNLMAAVSLSRKLGIREEQILNAISNFLPLEGRLETVGSVNGIDFVNDTLATIPEATIEAIRSFPGREITLILGGYDRGIDFDILGREISKNSKIDNIILVGETGKRIQKSLEKYKFSNHIYVLDVASMDDVVRKASEVTNSGGVVLLSPASTSFDMFKDYKDRGDKFNEAVNNLGK